MGNCASTKQSTGNGNKELGVEQQRRRVQREVKELEQFVMENRFEYKDPQDSANEEIVQEREEVRIGENTEQKAAAAEAAPDAIPA